MSEAESLIFIPAWNERESVAGVISSVREELPDAELLVIDDGSRDGTGELVRSMGVSVATLPFNQGLGAALQTGYIYAERRGFKACAHLDSDGQHRASDVRALLEEIWEGRADLAIGSRWVLPSEELGAEPGDYRPTLTRSLGIKLFRKTLTLTTSHHFTDTTSGLRAAGPRAIKLFAERYSADYPELESLQRASRERLQIVEVPVRMMPRVAGESKINPLNSAFFAFNGMIVLTVGSLRKRSGEIELHPHDSEGEE